MTPKNDKKVRFLAFLPYGYTSRQALGLAIKIPEISYLEYSPTMPMEEREKELAAAALSISRQIKHMMATGYADESYRRFGRGRDEQFRALRLTKAGLYLLTSTPDSELEEERFLTMNIETERNRVEKTFRDRSEEAENLRQALLHAQTSPDLEIDDDELMDALRENISTGEMTVLALDSALAQCVQISPARHNGTVTYRYWRLANINALFQANGFLTYLDRRPMVANWAIGSAIDRGSYESLLENNDLDIPAFMYHALNKWYGQNPDSFMFMNPLEKLSKQASEAGKDAESYLRSIPAFYSRSELPGFSGQDFPSDSEVELTKGQMNIVRSSLSGIAVGPESAYVVYHTRPQKTPWSERVEMTTIELAENVLFNANQLTEKGTPYHISDAIMVCGSIYQFGTLFENMKQATSRKWNRIKQIAAPYNSISLVPINGSGAMQIRGLMLMTPMAFEQQIIKSIVDADARFERYADPIFKLTYDGIPVLVAHRMDFHTLFYAMKEYEKGTRFYVSCYPGQVNYIRKIMPNVEFL